MKASALSISQGHRRFCWLLAGCCCCCCCCCSSSSSFSSSSSSSSSSPPPPPSSGGGGGLVLVSAGHGGLCYCEHPGSQADHKNTNPQVWMIKIPIRFPT